MTEQKHIILVVDDEPAIRDSLSLLLKSNFEVRTAENGEEALRAIEKEVPDLILLDVMMPKLDGIQTLRKLRDTQSSVPVIMLTADTTVQSAVQAMKLGAKDYLSKPFEVEALTTLMIDTLSRTLPQTAPKVVVEHPEVQSSDLSGDFGPLVGTSPVIQEVFDTIATVAERDTTVLITGESGTGKELVAKQIHNLSQRKDQAFVAINCAAIPENLIESELFGHEKGAFTSAVDTRIGYFELANGGTIFLDEIGELSLPVQVKMLRFLQEQEFYRVGQSKPVRVNVRIIAATNKNLEEQIKAKAFRQDLFYRINVINMELPALRKRPEDIGRLASHFIEKYKPLYSSRALLLEDSALKVLSEYSWPGNVRELENVVESLMALCVKDTVEASDLPAKLRKKIEQDGFDASMFEGSLNFEAAEREFESDMIRKALRRTNNVQTKAAELLGISRRILKYKMDKLGISGQDDAEDGTEDNGALSRVPTEDEGGAASSSGAVTDE